MAYFSFGRYAAVIIVDWARLRIDSFVLNQGRLFVAASSFTAGAPTTVTISPIITEAQDLGRRNSTVAMLPFTNVSSFLIVDFIK